MNAMCYTRDYHWDYDWAELGTAAGATMTCCPCSAQNHEDGENAFHGTGGKLNIANLRYNHPVSNAFVRAGVEAGHPETDDFNNDVQEGVGLYKVNQKDGERCGVSRAYLHPAMDRPNLTVLTNCLANRILFEGKRAVGVEVEHNGQIRTLKAASEVILSGGAINSPQVLKLSGVGPAAELAEHNIPLVHDLPGVGENLQDHPDVLVVNKSKKKDTLSLAPGALLSTGLKGVFDFFYRRTGQLTSNVAGPAVSSSSPGIHPDLQPVHLFDNHGLNFVFSMGGYSGHARILRLKAEATLPCEMPTRAAGTDRPALLSTWRTKASSNGKPAHHHATTGTGTGAEEIYLGKQVQSDDELRDYLCQ